MTDQTESASEYAEVLDDLDFNNHDVHVQPDVAAAMQEGARAIRALEAKVRELKAERHDTNNEFAQVLADREHWKRSFDNMAGDLLDEKRRHVVTQFDRDQLAGEVERLHENRKGNERDYCALMERHDALVNEVARLTSELDERRNVSRRNGEQGKATDEEWLRLTSAYNDLTSELAAARENEARWQRDVADAYGWLWCVNEEPGTPNRFPAERAAYNARKLLRDLLTGEQRGIGINKAVIQRDAARSAGGES